MRKITLITFFASVVAFTNTIAQQGNHNDPSHKPTKNIFFCPAISALKKDPQKLTWSVGDNWKSHDTSFISKVTEFLGAQWNGVKVGQITCVYKGIPKTAFPILLIYNTLTLEPHPRKWNKKIVAKWGKNLGGYRNCVARNQKNCPFQVHLRPPHKNIFKELEKFKSS